MVVDGHGLLIDLWRVPGILSDPTVRRVEWFPVVENGQVTERGIISLKNGDGRCFSDRLTLVPYLAAFAARKDAIEAEQVAYRLSQEFDDTSAMVARKRALDAEYGPVS